MVQRTLFSICNSRNQRSSNISISNTYRHSFWRCYYYAVLKVKKFITFGTEWSWVHAVCCSSSFSFLGSPLCRQTHKTQSNDNIWEEITKQKNYEKIKQNNKIQLNQIYGQENQKWKERKSAKKKEKRNNEHFSQYSYEILLPAYHHNN